MIWIIAGIFFAAALLLLSGHGAWLIAGYNTASEEEKAKFDEKKLCRTMGTFLLYVSVGIVLLSEGILGPGLFAGLLFGGIALLMISANTACKKK